MNDVINVDRQKYERYIQNEVSGPRGKSAALFALFIFLSIGAGVGVFFGARAAIDAVTTLTDSLWLALYIAIVAALLLCLMHTIALFRDNLAEGAFNRIWPVVKIDLIILATAALLAAAFIQAGRPWLPGGVLCGLMGVGLVILLVARLSQGARDWFHNVIFNPEKGFGGAAFADVANFVAVVGAIGVHAGFTSQPSLESWYWAGHFGALLAFASALSLLARWVTLKEEEYLWPGLFGLGIVILTVIALELGAPESLRPLAPRCLVAVPWAVVLVFGLGVCFKWLPDPHLEPVATRAKAVRALRYLLFVLCALFVFLMAFEVLVWTRSATPPAASTGAPAEHDEPAAIAALVLTLIAMLFWIAVEGWSAIKKTHAFAVGSESWMNALFYQEWEKNLWEVLGGATIMFYVIGRLALGPPGANTPALTIILLLGICCGLLGTLRGVIVGVIKKHG